jgi:hypothetical protein
MSNNRRETREARRIATETGKPYARVLRELREKKASLDTSHPHPMEVLDADTE